MDIKAMREKLNSMKKKGGNDSLWKPEEGETTIRIIPLKSNPEDPFQVLYFHYELCGKTYLSPISYGERDPLAEFSDALIAEHDGRMPADEYKQAKQFYPQARTFVPIVVRGKEAEGVKFWAFGKQICEKLLAFIADEEYGDISHPKTGTDITVTFTPKKKSDTNYAKTDFVLKRKSSPLSSDAVLAEKWLNDQPVLLELYTKTTASELEKLLEKTLAGPTEEVEEGTPTTVETTTQETSDDVTPAVAKKSKASVAIESEIDSLFD
jgi:hypothetical protein